MDKKTLYHIIQWSITLAACAFLVWKIATYEDYTSLGECLRRMGWQQWLAIVACVALMPLNMTLEAWRWKTLYNGGVCGDGLQVTGYRMSWREAHRQVYYSKLAGLITPWRLGEYPSRALLMARDDERLGVSGEGIWPRVLSMGAVGSATMTLAIIIAGTVGLAFSPSVFAYLGGSYLYAVGAVTVVLCGVFALMPMLLKKYATVNAGLIIRSTAQSLVRLACWCVQLGLVLYALGAVTGEGLSATGARCFVYYLLVTITPNVPIAEVGVRGAWAIVVFGTMNAALAGVLLWVINTFLPCLIWPFLRKKS